jgi:hypothetical protein
MLFQFRPSGGPLQERSRHRIATEHREHPEEQEWFYRLSGRSFRANFDRHRDDNLHDSLYSQCAHAVWTRSDSALQQTPQKPHRSS